MKRDTSFGVLHRNDNHSFVVLAMLISMLLFPSMSHAKVLFSSTWGTATGTSNNAIGDGGKWDIDTYGSQKQDPEVFVDDGTVPGGNNFLRVRPVGTDCSGGPGHNWIAENTINDPNDIYIRLYFRMNEPLSWNAGESDKHWLSTSESFINNTNHILSFEHPQNIRNNTGLPFSGDYGMRVDDYSTDHAWDSLTPLYFGIWYRYEIHIQNIGGGKERWYTRLDGVDITNTYRHVEYNPGCPDPPCQNDRLQDDYDLGWAWDNNPHNGIEFYTYDMCTLTEGWDITAMEIRDDTWPGPVVPDPPKNLRIVE
jgi:hypothetical protein